MAAKKILIVSDTPTHPVTGGNRACILQNARLLSDMGYDVRFLYVHNYDAPEADIAPTREHWGDRFHFYRLPARQHLYRRIIGRLCPAASRRLDFLFPWGLNRFVDQLHRQHHFHGLLANYVWLSRLTETSIPVKALYAHDVFSNRAERLGIADYSWRTFSVAEEEKGLRRFDHILAIQHEEARYFSYLAPQRDVRVIYSPVEYRPLPPAGNHNILYFAGNGLVNVNGLAWFVREVFPLVLASVPDARLLIGGTICRALNPQLSSLNGLSALSPQLSAIDLIGTVADPADFYRLGDVAINPVSQGTGLKIKTLEALSYGRHLVVHPHSADGLFASHAAPLPLSIADDPAAFATRLAALLTSPLTPQQTACAAYLAAYNAHIRTQYSAIFGNP